jgi:predicted transcriptional regulator
VVEKAIEGTAKQISEPVRARLVRIVNFILDRPGIKSVDLSKEIDISESVLKGNIKTLVDIGLIVYNGSKKTGGYYPSEKLKGYE